MIIATRDIKEVEEFWLTYFMMKINMKDYFPEENEEDIRRVFGVTMEGQFEHAVYNKLLCNQLESNETVTLQQRIKWWMVVVDRGGLIPNGVYVYSFGELFGLYRKAIDPEMQELAKLLKVWQTIPQKS